MYFRKTTMNAVVSDKTFTMDMPEDFYKHFLSFTFFNGDSHVVPTSGSIEIKASDDGYNWGDIPNGSVDLSAGEAYVRPNFSGSVERLKFVMSGISGATKLVVTAKSFKG